MTDELSRLDAELVRRGLARSRGAASEAISRGLVTVEGRAVTKASLRVSPDAALAIEGADHYVSRGAHKLIAALDAFGVDPGGRLALDAGASTGGFTQVLLERGARHVFAVDVGHAQLASEMQESARVSNLEGLNIRELMRSTPAFRKEVERVGGGEPADEGVGEWPSLVVGDLSFISLIQVLGPLRDVAEPDADFVLLIKPQFEVGRQGVKEGIVRDRMLRQDAASTVLWAAWDLGLGTAGLIDSPILGGNGNREYLVHLRRGADDPGAWAGGLAALS